MKFRFLLKANQESRSQMITHQSQATQPVAPHKDDRVAVLLAGYGEVESYRDLSSYNQAATKGCVAKAREVVDWEACALI